jgi:hypothetical protein
MLLLIRLNVISSGSVVYMKIRPLAAGKKGQGGLG